MEFLWIWQMVHICKASLCLTFRTRMVGRICGENICRRNVSSAVDHFEKALNLRVLTKNCPRPASIQLICRWPFKVSQSHRIYLFYLVYPTRLHFRHWWPTNRGYWAWKLPTHGSGQNWPPSVGPSACSMLWRQNNHKENLSNANRRRTLDAGPMHSRCLL